MLLFRAGVRRVLLAAGRNHVGHRLLQFYAGSGLVDAVLALAVVSNDEGVGDRSQLLASAPTELTAAERSFLYSLVRGTRPRRVLEIGTAKGGSALIITTALEDNGQGELWTVDPRLRIQLAPELFHGRLHVVEGHSPDAVDELAHTGEGSFDLLFIDGLHIHDQVEKDLAACLGQAADGAFILLHDSFHYGISEAIREALEANPRLHDAGYVCNEPRQADEVSMYAGLRLLRVGDRVADATSWLRAAWKEVGQPPPDDPDLLNHDVFWCRDEPCARCKKLASEPAGIT